ncbi:MAG TPA: recombinase family protein [Thermodesulfovibrionales bacterium]|nr:recombinase family protein [Thermodesulfovibrionales bacterium]
MKKERAALYARCSTHDKGQDPELQLAPLREYCQRRGFTITGEYVDNGISGTKERRPQLDRLMDAARKRQIDVVLVWKLDRFGRSLKQLVTALDELSGLGIGFISFQDNLDLTTPQGRLMFHIIGAMAEFERELIRERVKAGIDNARRKGKKLGRKGLAPIAKRKIIETFEQNPSLSIREIAKATKQPPTTVHKILSFYRAGKLDRDGFEYDRDLCS